MSLFRQRNPKPPWYTKIFAVAGVLLAFIYSEKRAPMITRDLSHFLGRKISDFLAGKIIHRFSSSK